MFDHKHYLPILTAKMGEYRALKALVGNVKTRLTPLLEIPPIDWDFANDTPANTIDEQIASVADNIEKNWGTAPIYVDIYPVANQGPTAAGDHPLTHIFADARGRGLQLIPVTGINRDPAQQAAIASAIAVDQRGVCLRILASQIGAAGLQTQIDALLASLGVNPATTDLVIDFGPVNPSFEASYVMVLPTYINNFPYLNQWRSFSVSGSSFPNDLSGIPTNTTGLLIRTEWRVWSAIITGGQLNRRPTFSDYAIDSPEYVSLDFRVIKMTANIRYTHYNEWIVIRGGVLMKGQPSQYPNLAAIARALPQYMGPQFSWGDKYIDDCANGTDGPGNATTWRQVGTNHHLTFVVQQIANHPGL